MAQLTSRLILEMVDRVTGPARGVNQTVSRLRGQIDKNNRAMNDMRGQMFDAVAAGTSLALALRSPLSNAIALESAMADVTKVVDFESAEAVQAFQQALMDLSETPGFPSAEDLAALAAEAGAAGIAAQDLTRFTEAAAKVGTAFDISASEAGQSLAKLMTAMGMSIDEVILLSDSMNHLSNSQASSASEILDVVRRVGAQATQFGFTATQTSAFASAMIAAGAESEVAATSFRNMGLALTAGESATARQKGALADLGLEATDVAKRMQEDATGTTIDVLRRLGELPKEVRAAVSNDLFGREARALGPLLANTELLHETLGLVAEEGQYAGSAYEEFERRAETFGANVAAFGHRLKNLSTIIGNALIPQVTDLISRITPVIEAMSAWISQNPELVSAIITATTALVGFRVALTALRFAGLYGKGSALWLMAGGMNTIGRAAAGVGRAASESIRLQSALAGMAGAKVGRVGKVGAALKGIAGLTGLRIVAAGIGAVVSAVAAISAPAWLAIGAAVAAVGAAGAMIYKNWDRIAAIVRGVASAIGEHLVGDLGDLREKLNFLEPVLTGVSDAMGAVRDAFEGAVGWVKDFFGSITERNVLSDEQIAEAEDRARQITEGIIRGMHGIVLKLVGVGRDAISGLWEGMQGQFDKMMEWARTIPDQIREAVQVELKNPIRFERTEGGGLVGAIGRYFGGGEEGAQERAAGGWYGVGPRLVGERGPELEYQTQAGFIAHNRALRRMAGLAQQAGLAAAPQAVGLPQPRSLPSAGRGRQAAPSITNNVEVRVEGGANVSAEELADRVAQKVGQTASFGLRTHYSDAF